MVGLVRMALLLLGCWGVLGWSRDPRGHTAINGSFVNPLTSSLHVYIMAISRPQGGVRFKVDECVGTHALPPLGTDMWKASSFYLQRADTTTERDKRQLEVTRLRQTKWQMWWTPSKNIWFRKFKPCTIMRHVSSCHLLCADKCTASNLFSGVCCTRWIHETWMLLRLLQDHQLTEARHRKLITTPSLCLFPQVSQLLSRRCHIVALIHSRVESVSILWGRPAAPSPRAAMTRHHSFNLCRSHTALWGGRWREQLHQTRQPLRRCRTAQMESR